MVETIHLIFLAEAGTGGGFDLVLLLALMILTGMFIGRLAERFHIPNVSGYLFVGIVFGLGLIFLERTNLVDVFILITTFALGFIAFSIGLELNFSKLKKRRREVIIITLTQAVAVFIFTTIGLVFFGLELHIALLLGTIAIATEPGPILQLTKRYKTKGELTDTLVPLHGVEDAFAIILFGIVLSYALSVDGGQSMNLIDVLHGPAYELGFSILIGVAIGFIFRMIIFKLDYEDPDKDLVVFVSAVVAILFSVALANRGFYFFGTSVHLSPVLLPMVVGITFANLSTRLAKHETEHMLDQFSPPVLIMFFTLVGAEMVLLLYLETQAPMLARILLYAAIYVLFRISGKLLGSYLGAVLGKSTKNVRKYLGFCLLPQAQAAIGLAFYARSRLTDAFHGNLILLVVIVGTLVYELLGPFGLRHSLIRCEEVTDEGTCIVRQRVKHSSKQKQRNED